MPAAHGRSPRLLVFGQWAVRVAIFTLAVVHFTPVVHWAGRRLSAPFDSPTGDTLIVLTGSAQNDSVLGLNSYWRAVYAVRAWKKGGFRQIIVSGGGNPAPALPMRDFLLGHGVPSEAIRVEAESLNTRDSAVFLSRLLEGSQGSLVLLTSDYHMFRARRVFEKAGLKVALRPCPDVTLRADSWAGRWPAFLDLVREATKIVYYKVRGWI